jgi:hypothetical protein
MRLKISTKALDDHDSRLYCSDESTDTVRVHFEDSSCIYTIIKRTKTVTTVEMNEPAIKEFLSDADYWVDCMQCGAIDQDDNTGRLYERAAASVRKQLENQ